MSVTTHLRNQILAAVDHASAAHRGPLSMSNTITDAVAETIEAHAACRHCAPAGPWTRHGHAVPGVTVIVDGPGRPPVGRCGGPQRCRECGIDVLRISQDSAPAVDEQPRVETIREVLRERLCGFDDDGERQTRVELLGSLDEIAAAVLDTLSGSPKSPQGGHGVGVLTSAEEQDVREEHRRQCGCGPSLCGHEERAVAVVERIVAGREGRR